MSMTITEISPYEQLDYLEQLHFDHQKRIENEATEIYIEEYLTTGNTDYAKYCYFKHINLYL